MGAETNETEVIFEEGAIRVEESRYPTGAVRVFDGDEELRSDSKVGGGATSVATAFAKGIVHERTTNNEEV